MYYLFSIKQSNIVTTTLKNPFLRSAMSTANLTSYKETHLNKPQEIQFSANPATISRASSRRLSHFCRRGKKETREAHIRTLVRERERGIKTSTSRLPEGHFDENSKIASSNLFEPFFKVATPFIGLKTRRKRRGNRVIHKLMPLDRSRSERKPFVALAAIMRTSGKTAKPFYRRLGQQLEKLYNSSVARRANAREVSPLQEKRDEVHRTAFDARPYRWKKLLRKKQLKLKKSKLQQRLTKKNTFKKKSNRVTYARPTVLSNFVYHFPCGTQPFKAKTKTRKV